MKRTPEVKRTAPERRSPERLAKDREWADERETIRTAIASIDRPLSRPDSSQ